MDLNDFPDGVLIAGPDERVLFANDRAVRMTGIADPVGMHLSAALPFDDLKGNLWFERADPYGGLAIRTGISERSWWSPTGVEYLVTARITRDADGTVRRVVVAIRNARVRKVQDRERSDLVATVAHELRSPLTGIKGFSSTLLSKWDRFSDDQRQLMLETVDADADRLGRLVTELLDAARIDAGRLMLRREPVKVDELLERLLRSIGAGKRAADTLDVVGEIDVVWADSDRLIQVFTNLVENAMRHGRGLTRVIVEPEGDGVLVQVQDGGRGIPEDERERVFTRFWRSGPGAGSGLGMYIAAGIVDQLGGWISIDDVDGGGANVRVWLPRNVPEALSD
ncbi:MAG TPA: PAS domain-containing sensor histidine kinase [Aeromicrobium sp.]|nr:PAS domain-containing sensor histidine kinase [Aeromicrobium sp.]